MSNETNRKEPDLCDLFDNKLLQFAYRMSVSIMRTIYRMAFVILLLVVVGLALSWFSP